MGGETLPVGPFQGGLNLALAPRLINEAELQACTNFDIGTAGELSLRRPFRSFAGPGWTNQEIMGVVRVVDGNDEIYLLGTDAGVYKLAWTSDTHSYSWQTIKNYAAGNRAGDATQYNGKVWVPSTGSGASEGVSVDVTAHVVAPVAGMPKGSKSFIYKDRLFVFDTDSYRVYYSTALDLTAWPAANFFDINPGDGEPVVSATVTGETVIFFKSNSTWHLYFDSDPGLGTLRRMNTDIGVSGEHAVAVLDNSIYTMDRRAVYRLTNSFFESISENLDLFRLRSSVTSDAAFDYIRPLGDRLIVRIKTATTYRYFIYRIENRIWTEYTTPAILGTFYRVEDADNFDHYVAASSDDNLYSYSPSGSDAMAVENFIAEFETKEYDYGDPAGWKRIFWHSFEGKSNVSFDVLVGETETVHPIPVDSNYRIFKSFLSTRFRTTTYGIQIAATAASIFEYLSGSINVAAKKRVVDRETA